MRDENAVSRMSILFSCYHALLRKHGIGWVTDDNPKIAIKHSTSAVRPEFLRSRLQYDLSFGYKHLKNDLKAFMAHCLKLSEEFQLLDLDQSSNKPTGGLRYLLKYCKECPEDDKKALLDDYFAERERYGPATSTRSHRKEGNIGRLEKQKDQESTEIDTSCSVLLADSTASFLESGRCDDGSDDTIISPKIAESGRRRDRQDAPNQSCQAVSFSKVRRRSAILKVIEDIDMPSSRATSSRRPTRSVERHVP